jgi:hypothetical protein
MWQPADQGEKAPIPGPFENLQDKREVPTVTGTSKPEQAASGTVIY